MKPIVEVHIAPVWNEYDRVLSPLERLRPDVVYLLEDENAELPAYYEELHGALYDLGIEVRLVSVDLFDMYEVMGCVTTLVEAQSDDETVRVNVTSGTKHAAIGATMACMDEGTDALPYYVNEETPQPAATVETNGRLDTAEPIEIYPIETPSRDQLVALALIEACNTGGRRTKFRTIIDKGDDFDIACFRESTKGKGLYQKLHIYIIDPLETKSYIEIKAEGRSKYVEVTSAGLQTLRAFRHRIEDVIAQIEAASDPRMTLELTDPTETIDQWHPSAD